MAIGKGSSGTSKNLRTRVVNCKQPGNDCEEHDKNNKNKIKKTTKRKQQQENAQHGAHQMEMIDLQRRERNLQQRLVALDEQRKTELQNIVEQIQRVKEECQHYITGKEKLTFHRAEIRRLKEENEKLRQQQTKLETNLRNLRINNLRLEKFGQDNDEMKTKLEDHHVMLVRKHEVLVKHESNIRKEYEQTKASLQFHTQGSWVEHALKLSFRRTAQYAVKKVEHHRNCSSLAFQVFEILETTDGRYDEETLYNPVPFPRTLDWNKYSITHIKNDSENMSENNDSDADQGNDQNHLNTRKHNQYSNNNETTPLPTRARQRRHASMVAKPIWQDEDDESSEQIHSITTTTTTKTPKKVSKERRRKSNF